MILLTTLLLPQKAPHKILTQETLSLIQKKSFPTLCYCKKITPWSTDWCSSNMQYIFFLCCISFWCWRLLCTTAILLCFTTATPYTILWAWPACNTTVTVIFMVSKHTTVSIHLFSRSIHINSFPCMYLYLLKSWGWVICILILFGHLLKINS